MRNYLSLALTLGCWLLFGSRFALAQHETGSDVFSGQQYFQNYCANCHGAAGNLIAGVDLGHGVFRQPYTDDELMNIVMKGIPGKAMPATPTMSPAQAVQVVAYLRSLAMSNDGKLNNGDAAAGQVLFAGKGACFDCHRLAGAGSRLGPDLSKIGVLRTASQLAASLLDPNAEVQANNRYFTITTKKGERSEGRLLNQDTFSVQLLDNKQQLRSFMKADLQSYNFAPSPMPSLKDKFTEQELADLVQYLASLRGATQQ